MPSRSSSSVTNTPASAVNSDVWVSRQASSTSASRSDSSRDGGCGAEERAERRMTGHGEAQRAKLVRRGNAAGW